MQEAHSFRHWYSVNWYSFSLVVAAVLLIALMSSCSTERTVISRVTSPDSNYVVQIVSIDNAGPGQNDVSFVVQLKNKHAEKFEDISAFNGNGVIEPTVHAAWKDNNTLLVTYRNAIISFQAVKIGTVSIEYGSKS